MEGHGQCLWSWLYEKKVPKINGKKWEYGKMEYVIVKKIPILYSGHIQCKNVYTIFFSISFCLAERPSWVRVDFQRSKVFPTHHAQGHACPSMLPITHILKNVVLGIITLSLQSHRRLLLQQYFLCNLQYDNILKERKKNYLTSLWFQSAISLLPFYSKSPHGSPPSLLSFLVHLYSLVIHMTTDFYYNRE